MRGGGGANLFVFIDGRAGGQDVMADFNPARDLVALSGYGPGADADAASRAAVIGGSTLVTLRDGTQILFAGVGSLPATSLV
jgi:hypothetical protein